MTQTAEDLLKQGKVNQQGSPKPENGKPKKSNKDIESSLAIVAEAQYQNGLTLANRVGEQSFLKGIIDGVENLINAQDLDDNEVSAIAEKFQNLASKRLKGQSRQPLVLPASAWLADESEEDDE